MTQKSTFNNYENKESTLNNEEDDYQNLIIRLKQISANIALLEKTIFR